MKKTQHVAYSLLCILVGMSLLGSTWAIVRSQQRSVETTKTNATSRITNILDGHGDRVRSIALQNTTSVNGAITIAVDTLQTSVQFANYSGQFRWNAGNIEFTNDNGATWWEIGTGGGVQYGLDDNGAGTMATATIAASTLSPIFFKTDWHWSAALILDTLQTCTLWDFVNSAYSAVRLRIGINASNQLYVTVGTDLNGTPATTTYTYTAQVLGAQETGVPIQVDVSYDGTNDEVVFCINGTCGAVVAAATDFDNYTTGTTDTISLGSSVDGRMLFMAFGENDVFPASSWKGITKEGAYPNCAAQWNFNEKIGATLGDVCGSTDLACDTNDWVEVEGGY